MPSRTLREVLQEANDITISGPGDEYRLESGEDAPETLFRSPASLEDIDALEKRLSVTLPTDYREFLSISNGFYSANNSEDGMTNGYFPTPSLFRADQLHWKSKMQLECPAELLPEIHWPDRRQEEVVKALEGRFPTLHNDLLLGQRDLDTIWLVNTDTVRRARDAYLEVYEEVSDAGKAALDEAFINFAGSREAFKSLEWCCMTDYCSGSMPITFGSFTRYLEDTIKDAHERSAERVHDKTQLFHSPRSFSVSNKQDPERIRQGSRPWSSFLRL